MSRVRVKNNEAVHVVVDSMPAGGSGLTDAELRAADVKVTLDGEQVAVSNFPASQAVTGTFWQATQPVSIASMPATPVTDNGGSLTVDGTVTANAGSGTFNVGAASQAATAFIPVKLVNTSDAFYNASGGSGSGTEYADGAARGTATGGLIMGDDGTNIQSVKVDSSGVLAIQDNGGSITVDGTFWQATQPVSGPLTDTQLRASAVPVSGTFWQATQPVSLASLPSLAAGTAAIGRVTDTAQTGRVLFAINYNATNAAAADTLLTTLVVNRGGTATTGQTSVAVTSGKTLRICAANVSVRTTTAATPWGVLTLRMNPSGAAVLASPVVAQFAVSGSAAVAGNSGSVSFSLGDEGVEFSGTNQIGLSFANNVNTNVTAVTLIGYEYTTPS